MGSSNRSSPSNRALPGSGSGSRKMLNISYEPQTRRAILTWGDADRDSDWVRLLRRVFLDHTDDVRQTSSSTLSLPWWTFLSARQQVKEVLIGYKAALTVDGATQK